MSFLVIIGNIFSQQSGISCHFVEMYLQDYIKLPIPGSSKIFYNTVAFPSPKEHFLGPNDILPPPYRFISKAILNDTYTLS